MKDNEYQPPKVWTENNASGGVWSKINRPTAGARYEADLPVGKHPLQLYSMGTPNGQKVTILLEELLALGEKGAEYDAHLIRIGIGCSGYKVRPLIWAVVSAIFITMHQ